MTSGTTGASPTAKVGANCERDVHPESDGFVVRTRDKYQGLLKHLSRTFEALREEKRLVKCEPQGEDPGIDAIVEAYADTARGLEPSAGLFQRRRRLERDVAVLSMVDMSGSTKGWINDVQRKSLVLLCESFGGAWRLLCHLWLLGLHPHLLRAVPGQALRQALR